MTSAQKRLLSNGCHNGFLKSSCTRTYITNLERKVFVIIVSILCFSHILSFVKINVIFMHNGILLSDKKEQKNVTCSNMDGTKDSHK